MNDTDGRVTRELWLANQDYTFNIWCVGVFLCCTVIGAIIGIPLIIWSLKACDRYVEVVV